MLKKILTATLVLGTTSIQAAQTYQPIGPNLGYGNLTISQSLLTLSQNPAAPAAAHGDNGLRLHSGISINPSIGVEIGDLTPIQTQVDALPAGLDLTTIDPADIPGVVDTFNDLLTSMNDNFYLKQGASTNVPFFPLIIGTSSVGSITLSADVTQQSRMRFLSSPVEISGATSIDAGGAIYLKAAYAADVGLGYSRRLMEFDFGNLYIGAKAKVYSVGTNKTLISASIDGAGGANFTEPTGLDFSTSSGNALEVGMMLMDDSYQLGVNVTNLGSPSYAYPVIGQDCASLPLADQESCYVAIAHSDEISLTETHIMNPQVHVEAAMLGGESFILGTTLDLNPINDMVGDQVQYFSLTSAYAPSGATSLIIPRFRAGLRKNLVGSGLASFNLGMSLFRLISLDYSQALNTTTIDGQTMARSYNINLGFGVNF